MAKKAVLCIGREVQRCIGQGSDPRGDESLHEKLSSAKCPKSSTNKVLQEFREKSLWEKEILKNLGQEPQSSWTLRDK